MDESSWENLPERDITVLRPTSPADLSEMTPAERYRYMLQHTDGLERKLLQLEFRWRKKLKKWTAASTVCCGFGRIIFAKRVHANLAEKARIKRLCEQRIEISTDALKDGRNAEAIDECDNALGFDPQCFDAFRLKGHAYLALKRFDECEAEYSKAITVNEESVEVLLGRARVRSLQARFADASLDIERCMDLEPRNYRHWLFRGLIRSKLNSWQDAASDFSRCAALGDRSIDCFLRKGMAEAACQRWAAAIESFGEVIRMDDRCAEAFVLRGRAHCCYRKWDRAEADFNTALKIDPGNPDAKAGLEVVFIPHVPLPTVD